MAEIKLTVLNLPGLYCYIPDNAILTRELVAWAAKRNSDAATINWQFPTADARIRLKRLYRSIDV